QTPQIKNPEADASGLRFCVNERPLNAAVATRANNDNWGNSFHQLFPGSRILSADGAKSIRRILVPSQLTAGQHPASRRATDRTRGVAPPWTAEPGIPY